MSLRRLALVCGLTLADYLLWNWSLSGNHTVLALVSGLTLPFLLLASTVLFALTLVRVISSSVRSGSARHSQKYARGPGSGASRRHEHRVRRPSAAAGLLRRTGRADTGPPPPDPAASPAPSAPASPASSARQRAA